MRQMCHNISTNCDRLNVINSILNRQLFSHQFTVNVPIRESVALLISVCFHVPPVKHDKFANPQTKKKTRIKLTFR